MENNIMLQGGQSLITREQLHKLLVNIKHNKHKKAATQNTKQNLPSFKIYLPQIKCKRHRTLQQKRQVSNESIQLNQPIIKPLQLKFNKSLSSAQKNIIQNKHCKMIELPVNRIVNSHKRTTHKMWVRQIDHITAIKNYHQHDKIRVDSKGKKIQSIDLLRVRKGKLLDIILNKKYASSHQNALQPLN